MAVKKSHSAPTKKHSLFWGMFLNMFDICDFTKRGVSGSRKQTFPADGVSLDFLFSDLLGPPSLMYNMNGHLLVDHGSHKLANTRKFCGHALET